MSSALLRVGMLLALIAAVAGCAPEDDAQPPLQTPPTYLAISGGGWRAHTAQAGWTMGLLDSCRDAGGSSCTLDSVFGKVEAVSSNSGGTWFNTMLAYSSAFSAAIEAPGALATYTTDQGYLGQEEKLILQKTEVEAIGEFSICSLTWGSVRLFCGLVSIPGVDLLVWTTIVDKVVFAPLGINSELASLSLGSQPQTWADDKALLFAATMVTDNAVLNEGFEGWDPDPLYPFYRATPTAQGVPPQTSVTPVSFSRMPQSLAAPLFLSAGPFTGEYNRHFLIGSGSDPSRSVPILATVDGDVGVLAAAAASSAALGAAASETVLTYNTLVDWTPWEAAYELSEMAPGFKLATSPIQQTRPDSADYETLADEKFVRLADGGYLDNSAVSHLVSFLQRNGLDNDFHVVAFDNVQLSHTPTGGGATAGIDISYLFGEGPGPEGICSDGFCVKVPGQAVFEKAPLETTPATWTHEDPNNNENRLIYTAYPVTTVDNPTLGVAAGSRGTLHAFSMIYPSAKTAPTGGASDFATYKSMLQFIHDGLTKGGGGKHLAAALGSGF